MGMYREQSITRARVKCVWSDSSWFGDGRPCWKQTRGALVKLAVFDPFRYLGGPGLMESDKYDQIRSRAGVLEWKGV